MCAMDSDLSPNVVKMRDVFLDCQTGHHSQASLIKAMTKVYGLMEADKFFTEFVNHMKHFLIVFKREPAVERAVDFVAKFSTSLQSAQNLPQPTQQSDDKSSLEESMLAQEDMHPFLLQLFRFLLENHKARDKAVRFRVCQLINRLFTSLGDDAAIDDSLYEDVYQAMQIRLRDKFPIVRVHAVLALARLQDPSDPDCPIIAAFKYMLEYDLNSDVRRAVMSSIAATTRTVTVMLERTRDVKDAVRRLAFQVIAEKIHVRALTIAQRVRLLRQGLDDRSESVREACTGQLIEAWLRTYDGDRLAVLGLLDVENSVDICQQLLTVLFKKSTPANLSDSASGVAGLLTDEKVIMADKLNSESAVYWRCLSEHLRSLGAEADEFVDKVLPSGVVYAKFLRSVVERLKLQLKLDEQLRNEFILQQLVRLIASLDLSDEVARKHTIQVLRELLLSDAVTHTVVRCVLARYSALHTDGDAFVASIAEIISDIREPITVQQNDVSREERRHIDLKLASVRVQLNQLRDELDECVRGQDFQRAAELKEQVNDLEVMRQALVSEAVPQCTEVRTEKTDSQTLLKCLSIVSELLTEPRFKKLTPSLQTLTETLILPGIQNADPAVRNQAIKSLGLCCLRSVDLARERLILLLQVSRMDQEVVQISSLQAIFDILHLFGLEAFKIEAAPPPPTTAEKVADVKDSDVSHASSDDFDDAHSETSMTETPQQQSEKQPDIGTDIMTILTDLLDHNSCEVRTVCAEGFAKLLLAGRVVSPSLLSRLLLLWYNPLTEDDTRLRHCVGTFLPLYAFASRRNQELVADAIMPTLQALFDAPSTSPLAEVKVTNVADLLVELTDVNHPMAAGRPANGVFVKDETPHDDVAVRIANEILSNPNSFDARVLVKVLCSLRLSSTNENVLKDLKVLCRRMLKEVKDKLCSRSLEKFTRSIGDKLQRLRQPTTDGVNVEGDADNGVENKNGFDVEDDDDDEKKYENEAQVAENGNNEDGGRCRAGSRRVAKATKSTTAQLQKAKKHLLSYSRLSPDDDEDCSISEDDTENDDTTFAPPSSRGPLRRPAAALASVSRFSIDDIDDDSDCELAPRQPREAAPVANKATATPAYPLRSTASKRKRSPLSEQSN